MSEKRSGKPLIKPGSKGSSAPPASGSAPVNELGRRFAESGAETLRREPALAARNPRRQAFQKILEEAQAAHPQIAAPRRQRHT